MIFMELLIFIVCAVSLYFVVKSFKNLKDIRYECGRVIVPTGVDRTIYQEENRNSGNEPISMADVNGMVRDVIERERIEKEIAKKAEIVQDCSQDVKQPESGVLGNLTEGDLKRILAAMASNEGGGK